MNDALVPERVLQQLEEDSVTSARKRGEAFRRLMEFHKANGDEGGTDRMATLAHAFSGVVAAGPSRFSDKRPRFLSQVEWNDGSSSPVFEVMTPERWGYVRKFRDESANPVHRARLSDFMWEGLKDPGSARDAIAAYLVIARPTGDHSMDDLTVVDAAVRSLELSVEINDAAAKIGAVEVCLDLLRHLDAGERWRHAAVLTRELLASPRQVRSTLELTELATICENAIKACPDEPARDSEREWLNLLERLHSLQGDEDGRRDCRARIASSHEKEGDFWANEAQFMLNASGAYERAVEAWKRVGGCEDSVARTINKLAAATRESHKEMRTVQTSVTITAEEMEAWRASVIDLFARHGIAILACRDYILPDLDLIEQGVRQARDLAPLQSLLRRTAIQDDRLVDRTHCPEENLAEDVQSYFIWDLRHDSLQVVRWVFEAIAARGDSVPHEVIGFVRACPLIAEWRHDILAHAVDAYGRSDYIASIHVLAFQLEGIVRDLASAAGLPRLTHDDQGRTPLRYLGHLLKDDALVKILGRRLTVALAAVLTEWTGFNVRNLVAHGEAQLELFSQGVNEILIILLLILAAARKEARAEDESQSAAKGAEAPLEAESE